MEITESVFPSKISIKVDFVRPFEAHNTKEFTLEPTGALTKVVWTITDFCNLAPFGSNGMKVAIRSDHCGQYPYQCQNQIPNTTRGALVGCPA
jgi:hypothetical protein